MDLCSMFIKIIVFQSFKQYPNGNIMIYKVCLQCLFSKQILHKSNITHYFTPN